MMDYELEHHGILGQKWGVRRYQNADGTLTVAGKKRYGSESNLYREQSKKEGKKAVKNAITAATAFAIADDAARGGGTMATLAKDFVTGMSDMLGGSYVESLAYGVSAGNSVLRLVNNFGDLAWGAPAVLSLAATGYAVYRAASALNKGAKAYKAKKAEENKR